jgi:hypothetical protein
MQGTRTLRLGISFAIVPGTLDCYIFIQDVQLEIKIRQPVAIDTFDFIAEPSAEAATTRLYQPAEAPSLSKPREAS